MESTFSLFHNTCMHLRVCQNLELIHIFSVFSQKILKRKKIKQHPFSCNTKLKLNPPYSVSFQFGPNWVSHPEKKMRGNSLGECASIVQEQEHFTPTNVAQVSIPPINAIIQVFGLGLLLILFSAPQAFSPGALANTLFPKTNIHFIKLKCTVEKEPH